ncbi:glycine/sarcosine/betaine reductase component B subunit [Thermanaerovibrio acidaminovorans]|jgi:glycine reductase|uniref:Glycine/sarcosine/betaine reductase complex protein B alpha and beta subunits n=1 Tax=Thermanaerovibrio acidaminovorans (strain ATCC 49978 / DSM 6589 / Su883) TaxID=525903 RepID=D1B5S9_THEAS|nr:glycine/sarcosine/betaine reductase component B subunit [Thermanaerovibrio acidaminovorans]ACZ19370.1 Glycine/sarcosine/betaine reductase complex protein B alpha and beta subunits [Thermanaerovibrio acidaminovorans DSM 6589]
MRLELHEFHVKALEWGETTAFRDGTLYVSKEELVAHLGGDERLKSVDVDLARPGERVRITPVKDVVEPRCKLEGPGEVFPGFVGDVETVGSGATLVLKGAAVVTCGRIVGFQEGIVDMSGPGADYTPFSKTFNVVLVFEPAEGLEKHEYESACRIAGLKAAHFLATKAKEASAKADQVRSFQLPPLREAMSAHPGLPKVAYLYMLQTQGLLHDTYVYGVDAKRIIPTLIHPNEVMDGAIVSGNCVSACDKNSTYVHLNNPVIQALYDRHGVDLNFVGCIITNENVTLADKKRSSSYATKLAAMLGVDGLVISEEGFGNPDTDLIMNCRKAETLGIRTVLITDEYAGRDGASQSLADAAKEADAVVTAGNANAMIVLPPMDRVIGFTEYVDVIAGGFAGSLREDGSIEVELQAITGATCELGFNRLSATTY